jgi:ribose transport system ATP-binding protein
VRPAVERFELEGVRKAYAGTTVLHGVALGIAGGEIHGLAGGNGSGKSTLIKILAGIVRADAGVLRVDGREQPLSGFDSAKARHLDLHFVHQETSTFSDLTLAENLAIGRGFETKGGALIDRRAGARRAADVLERFHIPGSPSRLLRDLSPAQRTMVAIARVLQDQGDSSSGLLVLDEPTAALPPREVDRLLEALGRYAARGQSILLVTHRLDEMLDACDSITVLRDGRNVAQAVPASIGHDGLVKLIVGVDASIEPPRVSTAIYGDPTVELRGITGGAARGLSFSAREGEIVGLAGLIGSGTSTALRMAAGIQAPESGEVVLRAPVGRRAAAGTPSAARVAYVPPDRLELALFPDESVRENVLIASLPSMARFGLLRRKLERELGAEAMTRYKVRAASTEMPISHLSGGNQQKVVLGRWLRSDPDVLILDEPTQGVDVGARAEIWALIAEQVERGMTVVVASSDIEELAAVCHRVLIVVRGQVAFEVEGDDVSAPRILELMHSDLKET